MRNKTQFALDDLPPEVMKHIALTGEKLTDDEVAVVVRNVRGSTNLRKDVTAEVETLIATKTP